MAKNLSVLKAIDYPQSFFPFSMHQVVTSSRIHYPSLSQNTVSRLHCGDDACPFVTVSLQTLSFPAVNIQLVQALPTHDRRGKLTSQ